MPAPRARRPGGEGQRAREGTLTRNEDVVKLRGDLGSVCTTPEVSTTRLFGSYAMQLDDTAPPRACVECGDPFPPLTHRARKFCAPACQVAAYKRKRPEVFSPERPFTLSRGTMGATSELKACVDLMQRGFHVYRAMSPACPCDLVVWKEGGKIIRVEVKTAQKNLKSGHVSLPLVAQGNIYDVLCYVVGDEVLYIPPVEEW